MKNICACMGPMFGEPLCPCMMEESNFPKNEAAREESRVRSEKQLEALFGPGGTYYKEPK